MKFVSAIRRDFRAAVLGLGLAAGFVVASPAQEAPETVSAEEQAQDIVDAQNALQELENFNEASDSEYIDSQLEDICDDYKSAKKLPDPALEARIRAAGMHAHKIGATMTLEAYEQRDHAYEGEIAREEEDLRKNFAGAGMANDAAISARIHDASVRLHLINAEGNIKTLDTSPPEEAAAVNALEKQIYDSYAAAGLKPDPATEAHIRAAYVQAHKAGIAAQLQWLESRHTPYPDEQINAAAQDIANHYKDAGLTPEADVTKRIHDALTRVHRLSAEMLLDWLSKPKEAFSMAQIAEYEQNIRDNFRHAEITTDGTLDAKIKGVVANAHRAGAEIILTDMEKSPTGSSVQNIENLDKYMRTQYSAGGVSIDAALDKRIRAAVITAYKTTAAADLKQIAEASYDEEIVQGEKEIRTSFERAGVPVDHSLEALIEDAVLAGHKNIAEQKLEYLEKYTVNYNRENLKKAEKEIRAECAAANVIVDGKLETRIRAALSHASRRWITRGAAP